MPAAGELVCCGQPMELVKGKTQEEMQEKHIPVFISENGTDIVQVGTVLHPMNDDHYIMFIETISEDKNCVLCNIFTRAGSQNASGKENRKNESN